MRNYAQVAPTFWMRGSGKELRGKPLAQAMAMYLFTCPASNMAGLFYLPIGTLASELGWNEQQAREAIEDVVEVGIVHWDEDEDLFYLPNGLFYQLGKRNPSPKDKRLSMVWKHLDLHGDHPFVGMFRARYFDEEPTNPPPTETIPGSPSCIDNQPGGSPSAISLTASASASASEGGVGGEAEPETESESEPSPPGEPKDDPVKRVWAEFSRIRAERFPDTRSLVLSPERRGHVRARIRDYGEERVLAVMQKFFDPKFFWGGSGSARDPNLLFRNVSQFEKVENAQPWSDAPKPKPKGWAQPDARTPEQIRLSTMRDPSPPSSPQPMTGEEPF